MILLGLRTWNTCTYVHNTNPSISTSTIPPFPSFRRLVTNKAVRNNDRPTGSYPFIGLFVCDCRVLTVTIPLCASSLTRHYPSSDSDWVEREPLFLLLQASSVSCISLFASRILRSRLLDFVVRLLTVGWYLNGTALSGFVDVMNKNLLFKYSVQQTVDLDSLCISVEEFMYYSQFR